MDYVFNGECYADVVIERVSFQDVFSLGPAQLLWLKLHTAWLVIEIHQSIDRAGCSGESVLNDVFEQDWIIAGVAKLMVDADQAEEARAW